MRLSSQSSTRVLIHTLSERLSQETELTSVSRESSQAMFSPVLDLERRLATENTLDIFTMQPKVRGTALYTLLTQPYLQQIRLQIASPTLSYARELRLSVKVLVRFTPKATGVEVIHHHGHIYILSDLFLLCEEMTREGRVARGEDGRDMQLCYPPLSGKVLSIIGVPGQGWLDIFPRFRLLIASIDNALKVSIMHKETLILEADSRPKRDRILSEFQECISFAKTSKAYYRRLVNLFSYPSI